MRFTNKALEAFNHLFNIAHHWVGRQSPTKLRNNEVETKPGDMLQKLDTEDREAIKDLKSDDLAEGKVSKTEIYMAADGEYYTWRGYTQLIKDAKLIFDSSIKKSDPRPKKY